MKFSIIKTVHSLENETMIMNGVLNYIRVTDLSYCEKEFFCFLVKKEKDVIVGGVTGYYFLGHVNVDWLWIEKVYRNKGLGSKLLKALDNFAIQVQCRFITLQHFDEMLISFYNKNGYFIEFIQKGFDSKNIKYNMRKELI